MENPIAIMEFGHNLSLTQDSHSESTESINLIERIDKNLNSSFSISSSMIALLTNIYLFADQRFRSNMIERWPIFLLGRNPQKQYGLVSWLESAQLYNTIIIKGVKNHFSLDVAKAHDLLVLVWIPCSIFSPGLSHRIHAITS